MNPLRLSLQLAAASANNIALSQTPVSGTALTIAGALATSGVATMDVPRRVLLTYGNEGAARTLVVTGTDRYGNAQSETLAVPSGGSGTVYTVYDYATVTRLLPLGSGWTAAATVGTNGVGSTPWFIREWGQLGTLGVLVYIPSTLTVSVNLELTWDDPNASLQVYPFGASPEPASHVPPIPIVASGWAGVTNTTQGEISIDHFAYRMTVISGTDPAVLQTIETTQDRRNAF